MLHRAAADALEARLKREAIDLFEQEQSADTWSLPDGKVVTAVTHDRQDVTDQEALLNYLEEYTGAVQTRTVREVSDSFLKPFLAALEPYVDRTEAGMQPRRATAKERRQPGATFPVRDNQGTPVPGVRWTTGGSLYSVSIKPDSARKEHLAFCASDYADGECTFEEMVADAERDHEALAAEPPPPLELPEVTVKRGGISFPLP